MPLGFESKNFSSHTDLYSAALERCLRRQAAITPIGEATKKG